MTLLCLVDASGFQAIADDCNKPFELRTEAEKEELYEKIAEQLAMIADNYNFNSRYRPPTDDTPSSSTMASLFAPAPTPATAPVSPLDEGTVLSSSVDPHSPTRPPSGLIPEVVVAPAPTSGQESPAVEGAVGGEPAENLLNPSQPRKLCSNCSFAESFSKKIWKEMFLAWR